MRRVVWPLWGLGAVGWWLLPDWRLVTWAWVLGLLVGIMNVNLLASAVTRAAMVPGTPAKAALTVSGTIRFGLVLALLAWILLEGPPVSPVALLAGLFLPEILVTAKVVWGHEPFDLEGETR
jgi:hypothetical protein